MRERREAKERRKPAPRGKARSTVAGPSGPGESPPIGTLVDGRRLGSRKLVSFDEGLAESGLASGASVRGFHPSALWSDRGRQRLIASLARGRQRRGEVALCIVQGRVLVTRSRAELTVVDRAEVGVQRQLQPSLGVGSPSGGPTSRCSKPSGLGRTIEQAQACCSRAERFVGARGWGRLQRSKSSIFPIDGEVVERRSEAAVG